MRGQSMTPFIIVLIAVLGFFVYQISGNYSKNTSDESCQNIENLSSSELTDKLKETKGSCCKCKISTLINTKDGVSVEASKCDDVCKK